MEISFDENDDLTNRSTLSTTLTTTNNYDKLPIELSNKLSSEKIKILLKQNDILRKQIINIQKESKDNIRVKKIKKLQVEIDEKLIISEAFKERLMELGISIKDIELIVDRALKGPAKVRPPRIEELQSEIAQLKLDKMRLDKTVDGYKKNGIGSDTTRSRVSTTSFTPLTHSKSAAPSSANMELDSRVAALTEALELAKVEIDQKTKAINLHKELLEQAEVSARQQKVFEEKLKRSEQKRKEVQKEAEYLHEELMNCLVMNEKYAYEIRDLHSRLTVYAGNNNASQESLSIARDDALVATHSKIITALETTVQRMQSNESRLISQLESLRAELVSTKNNKGNDQMELVQKQIAKLQLEQTKSGSDDIVKLKKDFDDKEADYKKQLLSLTAQVTEWKVKSNMGSAIPSANPLFTRPASASEGPDISTLTGTEDVIELKKRLIASHQRMESYKQLVKEKFAMVDTLLQKHDVAGSGKSGDSKELVRVKQELKVQESIVAARSNEIKLLHQQLENIMEQYKNEKDMYLSAISSLTNGFMSAVQHLDILEDILNENDLEVPTRPSFEEITESQALLNYNMQAQYNNEYEQNSQEANSF